MVRLRKLIRFEQTSGLLMIATMLVALAVANSPVKPLYDRVHHTQLHFRFGALVIDRPLVEWINEGLLVFFFLLVGLEVKRQFLECHLSSVKCAILPAFAALGGMTAPAAIYAALNWSDPVLLVGRLEEVSPRSRASRGGTRAGGGSTGREAPGTPPSRGSDG